MELDKFLEKFLPDYQARFYKETHTNAKTIFADEFWRIHFPEALQNFADKMCEKQSFNCAEYYDNNVSYDHKEDWMYNCIMKADKPNINEL